MKTIFVVLGPPAAGKTKWIDNYIKRHETAVPLMFDQVFNGHWIDLSGNKKSWSRDMMDPCSYHFYRCMFWTQTMSPLRKVSTGATDWLIEPPQPLLDIEAQCIKEKADRLGYHLVVVWCNAPIETRIERNRKRGADAIPDQALVSITTGMNVVKILDPHDIIWANGSDCAKEGPHGN